MRKHIKIWQNKIDLSNFYNSDFQSDYLFTPASRIHRRVGNVDSSRSGYNDKFMTSYSGNYSEIELI